MMSVYAIAFIGSLVYLALLFLVAYWTEKSAQKGRHWIEQSWVYVLSLGVYCTAWTFFGSVGKAAKDGLLFLSTYIGPTIGMPVWWVMMRKIIRICQTQRLTTLADFVAARYGKGIGIGSLVSIVCMFGIIPYMAIQIKAISHSLQLLDTAQKNTAYWSLVLILLLSLFIAFYGTRKKDIRQRNEGLVMAMAFESVFKLFAFLAVGIFLCWGIFDGWQDVFQQAAQQPALQQLFTFSEKDFTEWLWGNLIAFLGFMFLPRQFQMGVIENVNEKHTDDALWLFPLYLLVINIFVFPIALGGQLIFAEKVEADTFLVAIPLELGHPSIALLAYLGGFAAATSMLSVEAIALSNMLTYNLLVPSLLSWEFLKKPVNRNLAYLLPWIKRLSIWLVLLLSFLYFLAVGNKFSLVSLGMISFVGVAQFAPSIIGGLYWKEATRWGAMGGIVAGFLVWAYTLILPTMVEANILSNELLEEGIGGIAWLRPQSLMGLEGLSPITHGFFWSMLVNITIYVVFSLVGYRSASEMHQAELFVDILKISTPYESSQLWKGSASTGEIKRLLLRFLGRKSAEEAIKDFQDKYQIILEDTQKADAKWVLYAENLLSGTLGAVSSRILIRNTVEEDTFSEEEIFSILQENQETKLLNQTLQRQSEMLQAISEQLRDTNEKLRRSDKLKDEFISTVTHELRTPLTSIRAFAEILQNSEMLSEEERTHFLLTICKETERMSRLIDQVLDLEKFESGRYQLAIQSVAINELIKNAVQSVSQLIKEKNIHLELSLDEKVPPLLADEDKITQVLLNLLSNAIKFCPTENGKIWITTSLEESSQQVPNIQITVCDNGVGIPSDVQGRIFEAFFQTNQQQRKKPKGSGLGLAITKKIVELHKGTIFLESEEGKGTAFTIILPIFT